MLTIETHTETTTATMPPVSERSPDSAVSDRTSSPRVRGWLVSIVLVGLVVGLYLPCVGYGFVNWDDPWYVVENPVVKSWSVRSLWSLATEVHVRNYAPVTLATYLVEHTLWELWPGGYHLTNMLLHALNAVLAWFLVRQVTKDSYVAFAAAALFAVHPVQVESVAWISSRKSLLSASFILACLIHQLRPQRSARNEGYALLFLSLALLTKAIAIVVPAVVLAYDVLVRRRPFAESLARQFVPGILCLCLLAITAGAQVTELGGLRDHLGLSRGRILAVDAIVLWKYVGMLVWPTGSSILYDVPTENIGWLATAAILGWAAVACVPYLLRRRAPLVPFAMLATVLFLLPVLNLIPITTLMNDRYLYLPSIALFALFFAAVRALAESVGRMGRQLIVKPAFRNEIEGENHETDSRPERAARGVAWGLGVIAIVACTVATHRHLPVWRNGIALWRQASRVSPKLAVVQYQLADALHEAGRTQEAIAVLHTALEECAPDEIDTARIERKLAEWR